MSDDEQTSAATHAPQPSLWLEDCIVSVVEDVYSPGVKASAHGKTYDWRKTPGSEANTAKIVPAYKTRPLLDAVLTKYHSKAHFTAYCVLDAATWEPLPKHPRVNYSGIPWLEKQGYIVRSRCLIADVDNPRDYAHGPKKPWNDDLNRDFIELTRHPVLGRAAWFLTRHGWRVMQPLDRWVTPEEYAELAVGWHAALTAAGARDVDTKCKSFNHNYVLARVEYWHQGRTVDIDYNPVHEGAEPISPDAVRAMAGFASVDAKRKVVKRSARVPRPDAFATDLPAAWDTAAREIGEAVMREGLAGRLHEVFLLVAGTLAKGGLPIELLPEMVERTARAAGSTNPSHHRVSAVDTVDALATEGRDSVAGARKLVKVAPALLETIERCVLSALEETAPKDTVLATDTESMGEEMFKRLRYGEPGVVVLAAEAGSGKSHHARRVAADLARDALLDRLAGKTRVRPGLKTAFSVPTHALALEHTTRLRAGRTDVLRLFSPPSLRDESGAYVCVHRDAALPLAEAGVSIAREFCEGRGKPDRRCSQYDRCPARAGKEGPEDAAVVVGPFQLLKRLQAHAGEQGRLIIDEPPDPVETVTLTLKQMHETRGFTDIDVRYRDALRPLLSGLIHFVEKVADPVGTGVTVAQALELSGDGISDADAESAEDATGLPPDGVSVASSVFAWARASKPVVEGKPDDRSPPIPWRKMALARQVASAAKELARVIQTFRVVQDLADDPARVMLWVDDKTLIIKRPDRLLSGACQRQGLTALLEATPDPLLGPLRAICPTPPEVRRLPVVDRTPVRRAHIIARGGRSTLFKNGLPDPTAMKPYLCAFGAWLRADADTKSVGVVTFLPLAIAFRHALGNATESATALLQWEQAGHPLSLLADLVAAVKHGLRGWDGSVLTMHYGACRGLDSFHVADVDALATIGDPWTQLGDVWKDGELFAIDGDTLAKDRAIAELTQAQARIRAPQLTRSKRALHIGKLRPAGWGWDLDDVEVVRIHAQQDKAFEDCVSRLRACSAKVGRHALAKSLGVSLSALDSYLKGSRSVPERVRTKLLDFY